MRILGLFCLILCIYQCDHIDHANISVFQELSSAHHQIDFRNDLTYTDEINILEYLYFNNGGGVAIGDVDNDGLEDVLLSANQLPDRLYRNLGNLQFQDITEESGLLMITNWSSGVTMDDINGDGWLDIYICKVAPVSLIPTHNLLYINQQDGTFKEASIDYGLDFSGYSTQASFFDYDADGDLDVYLLNHSVHSTRSYGNIQLRQAKSQLSGDRLYENRMNEKESSFIDVSDESGIYSSSLGYGLGVVTADLNGDGHTDIYVGNDFHENDYLYLNNGDKTFTESISESLTHTSQYTMGVDAADINGDGHTDIFTTDMMPYDSEIKLRSGGNDTKQVADIKESYGFLTQYARNNMHIMRPALGYFTEEAVMSSVFATDWSWSVLLQDFNNDELTDIFISNGIVNRPNDLDYINYINTPSNRQQDSESDASFNTRLINQMPTLKIPNVLFTQNQNSGFSSIQSSLTGAPNYSNGASYADLDNDGDLDIIANTINGPISLLQNNTTNQSYIAFDLPIKNSRITIYYNGGKQTKEYVTTRGFQSSSTHRMSFGLGAYRDNIDSVIVTTPSNLRSAYYDIPLNQLVTISSNDFDPYDRSMYDQLTHDTLVHTGITYTQNDYDDLNYAPLAPMRLSQEGPAVSTIKVGDSTMLYVGGAHGSPPRLYSIPDQSGQVQLLKEYEDDEPFEDVNALTLDYNNDGYQDLYVQSGGNEYAQLDPLLKDRLYFSSKEGELIKVPISLPQMNGASVAKSDYDQDGFVDLFVGSRNVPGSYGLSPISFILHNSEGRRVEIAQKIKSGLITDSRWADLDADDIKELIIVGEWMAPSILRLNADGSFKDVGAQFAIDHLKGMFQAIELADINGDGLLDIFLGNIGLNTTWQTGEEDLTMYVGDFDSNGTAEPIIFNNHLGSSIPFADKALLQSQLPTLKRTHTSFLSFSQVTLLEELFPQIDKSQIDTKWVNTLESLLLLSSKDGYKMYPLPREVQLSCINDMLWIEEQQKLIYGSNSLAYSHELGQANTHGAGTVTFNFKDGHLIDMEHDFINTPIGTVVKKLIPINEHDLLLVTNKEILIYSFK